MKEKLSKSSVALIVILAIFGLATVVHGIMLAVNNFVLPLFIIHILEMACFVWAIYYALSSHAKSSTFFRAMLITMGLIIAFQASLDPSLFYFPHSYSVILLSFLAVVGLTVIYCKWKNYPLCKKWSWVVILCTIAIAVIMTLLPLDTTLSQEEIGDFLPESALSALAEVYTRPLLAACVLGCYMARMSQKAKETK